MGKWRGEGVCYGFWAVSMFMGMVCISRLYYRALGRLWTASTAIINFESVLCVL